MKLNRWMSGVFAASAVALACGCSSSSAAPPKVAAAVIPDAVGMTELMAAQLPGPSPRVGKTTQARAGSAPSDPELTVGGDDLDAPKESRRNDGSRRSGGFG